MDSLYWAKVRWRFKCTSRAVSFRIFQASLDSVFIGPRKDCPQFATFWYGQLGCLYQLGLRVFASRTWKPSYRSLGKLPPFYRTLIMLWRKHNGGRISERPTHYQSACTESLWGNPLIVDSHGKTLFHPSLARAGFQTIKDIFINHYLHQEP